MTVRFTPKIELFHSGAWQDISGDVYHRDRISISRGRADEGTRADPGKCGLTIENRDGKYSPRNPHSPLFGLIGRNTPIRVSRADPSVTADAFTRTVSGSWGSTPQSQTWSQTGSGGTVDAADFEVDGDEAVHHVETTVAYRLNYLSSLSLTDVDATTTFRLTFTDVTGGALEPANILLRGQDVNNYYMCRVEILTDETVKVSIHKNGTGGGQLDSGVIVSGLTHTAGLSIKVRAQAIGKGLRMKVWSATDAEPVKWTTSAESSLITSAGWVGLRSGVASGNTNTKPIDFYYDEFTVTNLANIRFVGEVSSWPPRWDVAGVDAYAPIEAAGILRRLGQGASPLKSSLKRHILASDPHVYWPMDGGKLSEALKPLVGNGTSFVHATSLAGFLDFGATEMAPWLESGAAFNAAASAVAKIGSMSLTPTRITAEWVRLRPSEVTSGSGFIFSGSNGTDTLDWYVTTYASSPHIDIFLLVNGTSVANPTAVVPSLLDTSLHHIRFDATQSGGNINYSLYVDGVSVISTSVAQTLAGITKVTFGPTAHDLHGHLALWQDGPPSLSDAVDAAFGHQGEPAGQRIKRLCDEEAVPFTSRGDLLATEPAGFQRIATFLELLDDAAGVDSGILHETRYELGLTYRTRESLYNPSPALTLDYAAGHISPPFEPTDDDADVRNDVTVERSGGSSARSVLETGTLSVQAPPDGVGRYDESVTLTLDTDDQPANHAGWRRHFGTWDEPRYPTVAVDLAKNTSLLASVTAIESGDLFEIDNPPKWVPPGPIELLTRGYSESFDQHWWDWSVNATPGGPWFVFVVGDAVNGRLDTAGSEIASGATVATDAGNSTISHMVVPDSEAGGFAIGNKAQLFTSAGALKESTVFTVTDKQSAFGFTNIFVSPKFAAAPVAGDQIKRADDTTLLVATDSGKKLWVTTASHPSAFPFAVRFGGEVGKVTGISGDASPQEFTVTRGVNGIYKAHQPGTRLRIARVAVS